MQGSESPSFQATPFVVLCYGSSMLTRVLGGQRPGVTYLQAVGHDDHAGVCQSAEQLPCGTLLLLPVVLLLRLGPGHPRWVMGEGTELPQFLPPSSPGGSRGRGRRGSRGGGGDQVRFVPLLLTGGEGDLPGSGGHRSDNDMAAPSPGLDSP